ncbi:MAG: hypothetical protein WKG00_19725 [Polyangiaceae bacterium]
MARPAPPTTARSGASQVHAIPGPCAVCSTPSSAAAAVAADWMRVRASPPGAHAASVPVACTASLPARARAWLRRRDRSAQAMAARRSSSTSSQSTSTCPRPSTGGATPSSAAKVPGRST